MPHLLLAESLLLLSIIMIRVVLLIFCLPLLDPAVLMLLTNVSFWTRWYYPPKQGVNVASQGTFSGHMTCLSHLYHVYDYLTFPSHMTSIT